MCCVNRDSCLKSLGTFTQVVGLGNFLTLIRPSDLDTYNFRRQNLLQNLGLTFILAQG